MPYHVTILSLMVFSWKTYHTCVHECLLGEKCSEICVKRAQDVVDEKSDNSLLKINHALEINEKQYIIWYFNSKQESIFSKQTFGTNAYGHLCVQN